MNKKEKLFDVKIAVTIECKPSAIKVSGIIFGQTIGNLIAH